MPVTTDLVCSARGCRGVAQWALQWNNPRLHRPERRKTWLACPTHRETLSDFLTVRGFLRETVPTAELPAPEVPVAEPGGPATPDDRRRGESPSGGDQR
jgi:hypothetical protein